MDFSIKFDAINLGWIFVYIEGYDFKIIIEPQHEISNNVVCATSKASEPLLVARIVSEY